MARSGQHERYPNRWHLDDMVVSIGGKRQWLWRAGDSEGESLIWTSEGRYCVPQAVQMKVGIDQTYQTVAVAYPCGERPPCEESAGRLRHCQYGYQFIPET